MLYEFIGLSYVWHFFYFVFRGREGKGGRNRQQTSEASSEEKEQSTDTKDGTETGTKTENSGGGGKKGRPKSPCEAIESEPYVNIEIVKYGRDPNNTFSSGTI